jgi:hypothetical protein
MTEFTITPQSKYKLKGELCGIEVQKTSETTTDTFDPVYTECYFDQNHKSSRFPNSEKVTLFWNFVTIEVVEDPNNIRKLSEFIGNNGVDHGHKIDNGKVTLTLLSPKHRFVTYSDTQNKDICISILKSNDP